MTIYHTIIFGVLFLAAASFVFQISENERALSNKSVVPIKTTDSNFDLNKY